MFPIFPISLVEWDKDVEVEESFGYVSLPEARRKALCIPTEHIAYVKNKGALGII